MRPYQLKPGLDDILLSPGMTESSYRKLRDTWYRKLKKSGFEDIEFGVSDKAVQQLPWPEGTISAPKRRTGRDVNVMIEISDERSHADFADCRDYWTMCRQFLHAGSAAPRGPDRSIWSLYSEGSKGREISRQLKISNSTVQRTIHRLEFRMRQWWSSGSAERSMESDYRIESRQFHQTSDVRLLSLSGSASI